MLKDSQKSENKLNFQIGTVQMLTLKTFADTENCKTECTTVVQNGKELESPKLWLKRTILFTNQESKKSTLQ